MSNLVHQSQVADKLQGSIQEFMKSMARKQGESQGKQQNGSDNLGKTIEERQTAGTCVKQGEFVCPVCGFSLYNSLMAFNSHLDSCLHGSCSENKDICELPTKVTTHPATNRQWEKDWKSGSTLASEPCKSGHEHHENENNVVDKVNNTAREYTCPVCSTSKFYVGLKEFNDHVDTCLNRQTVRQIVKEANHNTCANKRYQSLCTLYTSNPTYRYVLNIMINLFACFSFRPSSTHSLEPENKRRRVNTSKQSRTIDSFFK